MSKYYRCHCCGAAFLTNKPQDFQRDTGYGTCDDCHERVAASWVKYGGPGSKQLTLDEAKDRLRQYA